MASHTNKGIRDCYLFFYSIREHGYDCQSDKSFSYIKHRLNLLLVETKNKVLK